MPPPYVHGDEVVIRGVSFDGNGEEWIGVVGHIDDGPDQDGDWLIRPRGQMYSRWYSPTNFRNVTHEERTKMFTVGQRVEVTGPYGGGGGREFIGRQGVIVEISTRTVDIPSPYNVRLDTDGTWWYGSGSLKLITPTIPAGYVKGADVYKKAMELARTHNWCDVVGAALKELGCEPDKVTAASLPVNSMVAYRENAGEHSHTTLYVKVGPDMWERTSTRAVGFDGKNTGYGVIRGASLDCHVDEKNFFVVYRPDSATNPYER